MLSHFRWLKKVIFFLVFIAIPRVHLAHAQKFEGITQPFRDGFLSLTVDGIVTNVTVREGTEVTKEDVLLELECAQEEMETARRKLIWQNQAELKSAEVRVRTAQSILDGTRQLYESTRSVSREELQKAELMLQEAAAELELLQMREKREEIEYNMALQQLQRKTLRAPLTGIVSDIQIEAGEHCQPGQRLIRVVDISRFYVIANIDVAIARKLQLKETVKVVLQDGMDAVEREGTIDFIAPIVDPASGLQEVKLIIDNSDMLINPGVSALVILQRPNQ